MSDQMYKEFAISTAPEMKKVEENGRTRTRLETHISIVERSTGLGFTHLTFSHVSERGIENIILKNFPASQTSQWLRSERDLVNVTLIADLSADSCCGNMHTALRKLCDSKASSYWWNAIHYLPDGVMGMVWEETSKDLLLMPKTAKLCNYARAVNNAWVRAFERLYHAVIQWDSRKRICADEVTPDPKIFEALFDDMTNKQFQAYKQSVFMAMLAVDYLDDSDWAGMMGFMYETDYSPAETI